MSRLTKVGILVLSVLICSYAALGHLLGQSADDRPYRSLDVYREVLHFIQQDYVDEPYLPLVTSGALHGLLESLDPRSSYLTPREYAEYKKWYDSSNRRKAGQPRGEIGVSLSKRFGLIVVVAALPESPAQRAGLRTADILESIASFSTREMSVGQAQILLAGEPATSVKVAVVRRGRAEPQEIEITRAVLIPPSLLADTYLESGAPADAAIAYIRVPTLDPGRTEQLRQRLRALDRSGPRKLILDLRECASGNYEEAVSLAKLFLPSGNIATLRGQTVPRQDFPADSARVAWSHPLTVLISTGTSGPAEVLAAALSDHLRAETVGDRTWGSASEQKVIPLEDGSALVLTVANYFTPAGKSIPADGVEPKVLIEDPDVFADEYASPSVLEDLQLKKAIEMLRAAPASVPARKVAVRVPVRILQPA